MNYLNIRFDVNDSVLRDEFFSTVIPNSISHLKSDTKPEWGLMTAQHMFEHLVWVFEMSTGKAEIQCNYPEERCKKLRIFLHSNRPTPRDFNSPVMNNSLPELRYKNLDEAKEVLIVEINYFIDYFRENPDAKHINPVFGLIGAEDWHRNHYKHCFHHLLQFNLIHQLNTDKK